MNSVSSPDTPAPLTAIIIGTGFAGIGMAVALRKAGIRNFKILEKAHEVGGVWRDNSYPGAACDVPSHLYSFSFAANPNWSRVFASQAEIYAYLRECAKNYQLTPHIQFGAEVQQAEYDAAAALWQVTLRDGSQLQSTLLITATGQLSRPALPNIAGMETFQGRSFHSATWDHSYNLSGKRVAVIGTGASAIQFVPAIADQVAELSVFQRSPAYLKKRPDRAYKEWEKTLFANVPGAMKLHRAFIYLRYEAQALAFTRFKGLMKWAVGRPFQKLLAKEIADVELRAKLTPDYPIGCKRILLSSEYLKTMDKANVHLVTEGIKRVTEQGIETNDGIEHPADVIIYGTGFAATEFLAPMRITGRNGVDLNEAWQKGAQAYLGMSVPNFPNFFMLYGPNTNLGHNSIVYMLESQIAHVLRCYQAMQAKESNTIEVDANRYHTFNKKIQQRLANTVWQGCKSWYVDETGHNSTNWPGFTLSYRWLTRFSSLHAYHFTRSVPDKLEQRPSVLISGAANGIGRATARLFAQHGWFVGLGDIDSKGLDALQQELGVDNALAMPLDVTKADDWNAILTRFYQRTGRLDVLVNNAGLLISGNFEANPLARHHALIDVNLTGLLNGCYQSFEYLRQTPKAQVINLSSSSALYGQASLATYSATKFAVRGLTEALNIEWEKYGISVVDIMPLFVQTNMVTDMDANSIKVFGVNHTAEDVAQTIWKAASQRQKFNKVHWPVGIMPTLLLRLTGLTPAWLNRLTVKRISF